MRDPNTVYLVGMDECGSYNGSTTMTMRLLRGNQLLEVDDVLYVETDQESLESAWGEHMDMLDEDDELDGVIVYDITDEEADSLYDSRVVVEDEYESMEG